MKREQWYKILGKEKPIKETTAKQIAEGKEYGTVVFMQNSQDFDDFKGSGGRGQEGFFDSSEKEMAKFLSQWDMGYQDEVDSRKPWGSSDTVRKITIPGAGKYILTYNSGLGYAGLYVEQ